MLNVITPTLGQRPSLTLLGKQVDSLIDKQCQVSWIIVCPNATPLVSNVIEQFRNKNNIRVLIQSECSGIYGAINEGLAIVYEQVDSGLIMIVGDDDSLNIDEPDAVKRIMEESRYSDVILLPTISNKQRILPSILKILPEILIIILVHGKAFGLFGGWCHQGMIFNTYRLKKFYRPELKICADQAYLFDIALLKDIRFRYINLKMIKISEGGYSYNNNEQLKSEWEYITSKYSPYFPMLFIRKHLKNFVVFG